jgi:hypothetical protein
MPITVATFMLAALLSGFSTAVADSRRNGSVANPADKGEVIQVRRDLTKDHWDAVRKRLRELDAVGFQLITSPDGGCQFRCSLATNVFGQTQDIEVRADSEREAVRQALARAEQWHRIKRPGNQRPR